MTEPWSVLVTQEAERDLVQAATYISDVLCNPSAARALIDDFEGCVERLRMFPTIHPLVRDKALATAGYRWLRMGKRIVFFTLDETSHVVNVERVLYAHTDWKQRL